MAADPRFYEALGPLSAAKIARIVDGELIGDGSREVRAIAAPAQAETGELIFLSDPAHARSVTAQGLTVLVSDHDAANLLAEGGHSAILVSSPKAGMAKAAPYLVRARVHEGEALISEDAIIEEGARLSPGCIIGPHARIESGARIGAGAVIGPGVEIGRGSSIGARACVSFATVHAKVVIGAGSVIGETGFGLVYEQGEMFNLPHVGRVVIENDVTLGANVTVDRGMFNDTWLKTGCRIDNLCHIAHNVTIGEYTVMAAFAGVSGSVTIGRGVQCGGRIGIADHLTIGDGARLAADCAVMRDVPAGEFWAGSPGQPIRVFMRETAWLRRESNRARKRSSSGSAGGSGT